MSDAEARGASAPLLRKRYRRLGLLGRGGMASVYRGHDEALGREVAIKMYPATADEREAGRQEAEVNVLAGLSHHALVTLFDAGMDRSDPAGPRVYLVMELVRGTDLQQHLRRGLPSAEHISHVGYDLAEALRYIHHRDIVHRDIKPSNILLVDYRDAGTRARAKLTDFGIVQYRGNIDPDEPRTGTAAYLSPEQVRRSHVGPPSDVYSLGLVLLECFTGELAYPGEAVPSALARLGTAPAIPDAVPVEWRSLLQRMTAADPEDRPTAVELVDLIRDLVILETARAHGVVVVPDVTRIEAVRRYGLLDSPPDLAFDRVARLAAVALRTPIAIVSVDGSETIWSSAAVDPDLDAAALAEPTAAAAVGYAFHAEVPLVSRDGHRLGALCVVDVEPRELDVAERTALDDLAAMVMSELELRLDARRAIGDAQDAAAVTVA